MPPLTLGHVAAIRAAGGAKPSGDCQFDPRIRDAFGPVSNGPFRTWHWGASGNLASEPGIALRGHVRTEEDYQAIAGVIASLDADVIALQEVGSIPGAQRVLGSDYEVWFESRCLNMPAKCLEDTDDIYTAIAVKKSLVSGAEVFQIDELALLHDDECLTQPRYVRGAVGVKLQFGGQTYWIPSVHLKASCNKGTTDDPDVADDCATLAAQIDILRHWIETRPAGDAVIVTGDFNRRFLVIPEPKLAQMTPTPQFLPPASERQCWNSHNFNFAALKAEAIANMPNIFTGGLVPNIYTPKQFGPIDYFVVAGAGNNVALTSEMIELPGLYRFGNPQSTLTDCDGNAKPFPGTNEVLTFAQADPSDHCPIRLTLE